jgi:hypothetical protein
LDVTLDKQSQSPLTLSDTRFLPLDLDIEHAPFAEAPFLAKSSHPFVQLNLLDLPIIISSF